MKKLRWIICLQALMAMLLILTPVQVLAAELTGQSVANPQETETTETTETENPFEVSGNVLIKYHGTDAVVEIPAGVTVIGEWAFYGADFIQKVIFPSGLAKIGDQAFYWCENLKEVSFSSGLTEIGNQAFYWCENLNKVSFPSGLTVIGNQAFSGCRNLKEVSLPDTLRGIGYSAFSNCPIEKIRIPRTVTNIGYAAIPGTAFVECYKGTEGFEYVKYRDSSSYYVLDAMDFSSLTFTLSCDSYIYDEHSHYPEITVKDGQKTLKKNRDYYLDYTDNEKPGRGCVTVTADTGDGSYRTTEPVRLYFQIYPRQVTGLASGLKTSSGTVELQWKKNEECTHYEVYRAGASGKTWKKLKTTSKTAYQDKGRKADTKYRYYVIGYTRKNGVKYYGKKSVSLTVYTLPDGKALTAVEKLRKKGASAQTVSVKTNVGVTLDTTALGWRNWSHVSPVSEFKDSEGNYCFGYEKGSYYYIKKYNSKLKLTGSVRIRKKYPLFGSIACDSKGYYYIVWGKNDTAGKTGVTTIAVSKYNAKGKHVKTAKYVSRDSNGLATPYITRYPFDAGNCVIVIKGDTLVCSMAREMYNGHQSNCVVSVNTVTMKKLEYFSNYASHSFNQSLLAAKSGEIVFVNHGDAYPRGIDVEKQSLTKTEVQSSYAYNVPFHFYGETGNNYTGAQLGGIAEVSSGYMLAAAAPKSLSAKASSQTRNVFVQLLDRATLESKLSGGLRKGTSSGISVTDKGVKWLTNYSAKYTANAVSVVATDDDRIVVMWEKLNKDDVFLDSYYMILAANGRVLQKATSLQYRRLNLYEDPVYRKGCIYWTSSTGDSKKVTTYRLKLSKLTVAAKPGKVSGLKVEVSWWSPQLTWEAADGAQGYEVYRSTGRKGTYKKIKTLKNSGISGYTDSEVSLYGGTAYYYKVRAYRVLNGKKLTGAFSGIVKVKG